MPPYRAKLGTMSQTLSRACPSRDPGTGKTDAPHLAKRLVSLMKHKRCQCPGNVSHNVPNNVQDMDNVPQSTKACPGACKTHVQQKSQADVPELAKQVPRSFKTEVPQLAKFNPSPETSRLMTPRLEQELPGTHKVGPWTAQCQHRGTLKQ